MVRNPRSRNDSSNRMWNEARRSIGRPVLLPAPSKLLERLEAKLRQHEIAVKVAWDGIKSLAMSKNEQKLEELLDVSLADDLVIVTTGASGEALVEKVRITMAVTFDTFAEHGLRLSLEQNKTEVVLDMRERVP